MEKDTLTTRKLYPSPSEDKKTPIPIWKANDERYSKLLRNLPLPHTSCIEPVIIGFRRLNQPDPFFDFVFTTKDACRVSEITIRNCGSAFITVLDPSNNVLVPKSG